MATSADIIAGRAGVQMYLDQNELKAGLAQAEQNVTKAVQKVADQSGKIRGGMIMGQAGVGLQDFVTVLTQGGTLATAIGAVSNNIIQMVSMINPAYGGVAAIAIAFGQVAMAAYKAFSGTKDMTKEIEAARKEADKLAESRLKAAQEEANFQSDLNKDKGDGKALDKQKDKVKDEKDKARADMEGARAELNRLQNLDTGGDEEKERQRQQDMAAADKARREAEQRVAEAERKQFEIAQARKNGAKTVEQQVAEHELDQANKAKQGIRNNRPDDTGKYVQEMKAADERIRQAQAKVDEANRRAEQARIREGAKGKNELDLPELAQETDAERIAREIKEKIQSPEDVYQKGLAEAQQAKESGGITSDEFERRKTQLWNDRREALRNTDEGRERAKADAEAARKLEEDKNKAEAINDKYMTAAQRKAKEKAEIDRLFGRGLMTPEDKARALAGVEQSRQRVAGTFSGALLSGLSGSNPVDAIAKSTERTAKAAEETAKNTKKKATW